jgi:hypothetical protein
MKHQNSYDYNPENLEAAYTDFKKDYPRFKSTKMVDELRSSDYPRLDRLNQVYLDYTGSG